ncbi:phage tail assembly protein [Salmonella enterica]|nr:phage tail assembly protein [Salmonella enterica]EJS6664236.1 phage tail assembly protein [Salmonella enterica]EJW9006323.1 phage tail assembly protein [Salmonella enterica]ELZ5756870.1 phage tail assembly protein [Salmonella enterica]
MAHNEKLYVLELREPSYDEIEAIGFPFTVSGDGGVRLDSSVALKYIPVLAGIPRSSAAQLAKLDIFKACMLILNFFTRSETEEEEDSESGSTTPHTSGE